MAENEKDAYAEIGSTLVHLLGQMRKCEWGMGKHTMAEDIAKAFNYIATPLGPDLMEKALTAYNKKPD